MTDMPRARPPAGFQLTVRHDGAELFYVFATAAEAGEHIAFLRHFWPDAHFALGPVLH